MWLLTYDSRVTSASTAADDGSAPPRAKLVLTALVLVAGVANMNLAVANVALPDIGKALDASSTQLNLIAVGYSLGLAATVLYFGAIGDRFGRKKMIVIGMSITLPASLIAGLAPTVEILFAGRLLGGIGAGLAFPTTLAMITALWSGARRTRAIAAWSALGAAISSTGPLLSGALLEWFDWHAVFLVTIPLALIALGMALWLLPNDSGDRAATLDNLGGILSIVLVGATVLALNFAPIADKRTAVLVLAAVAVLACIGFVVRQLRVRVPLFDLRIARRRTFWVAAVGGIVIFGTLMGAMYVGQQFIQNVLGYSTLASGSMMLPAAAAMIVVAPQSAKLVESKGSRFTLMLGYVFIVAGLTIALLTWHEGASVWVVFAVYVCIGIGVGFAGTPASHSLTGSVPVQRAGMASSMSDLQRDLGGAIMQSLLGAVLTAGYATALSKAIENSPNAEQVSQQTEAALTKSFSGASVVAERYPQYSTQIIEAAKQAFVDGDTKAYATAIIVVLIGAAVVLFGYPNAETEREVMRRYASENESDVTAAP